MKIIFKFSPCPSGIFSDFVGKKLYYYLLHITLNLMCYSQIAYLHFELIFTTRTQEAQEKTYVPCALAVN
jgi:hypothetical protein